MKAANTDGGTFNNGARRTRDLNTTSGDSFIISLSANQFVLAPGKYRFSIRAPAYRVDAHKAYLRNVTDSTDALIGSSAYSGNGDTTQSESFVCGIVSINSAKTFEIQHECTTSQATDGFGKLTNFGVSEVFTEVEIEKIYG